MIALPSFISVAPCGYTKPLAQASAQPSAASLRKLLSRFVPFSHEFRLSFWFIPSVSFAQPQTEMGTLALRNGASVEFTQVGSSPAAELGLSSLQKQVEKSLQLCPSCPLLQLFREVHFSPAQRKYLPEKHQWKQTFVQSLPKSTARQTVESTR